MGRRFFLTCRPMDAIHDPRNFAVVKADLEAKIEAEGICRATSSEPVTRPYAQIGSDVRRFAHTVTKWVPVPVRAVPSRCARRIQLPSGHSMIACFRRFLAKLQIIATNVKTGNKT